MKTTEARDRHGLARVTRVTDNRRVTFSARRCLLGEEVP
ncbi:Uncharacterised protein [Amycolatopsis camponoti]|uniref:Uncharacterized protein n=1 Tax=Amycolatopsis camponoti TaxID=2606593 RepID=A0A6I8M5I4_9PSEU|nr:Uncharacterised protein [Amycolatopsis camponoti]